MSLGQTEALVEEKSIALQSMRTDTLLELKCLYTVLDTAVMAKVLANKRESLVFLCL